MEFSTRAQQVKRGSGVGNTPASYVGGPRSNLGPGQAFLILTANDFS